MIIKINEKNISIETNAELVSIVQQHPHDIKTILTQVHAASDEEYQALFPNNFEVLKTSMILGSHTDELLMPIFTDPKKFKRFIQDSVDLRITARLYPQYLHDLFEPILMHSHEFSRIFNNKLHITNTSMDLPEYKYLLAIFYFIYQHDMSLIMGHALKEKKPNLIGQIKNVVAKSVENKRLTSDCLAKLWGITRNVQKTDVNSKLRIHLTNLQSFLFEESTNLSLLEHAFKVK